MTLILGIYAALLTGFFLYEYFRKDDGTSKLFTDCIKLVEHEQSATEKLKAIASLTELRKSMSPWYEKYLSTIGVIGLFSMTIAAGVQTINSTTQQYRADSLESELEDKTAQIEAAQLFVAEVSSAIQSGAFGTQRIGDVERKILRYRLDELRSVNDLDNTQLSELFSLALVLREYDLAVEILEDNKELLNNTNPSDQLTLAEYYNLVGSKTAAQQIINELDSLNVAQSAEFVRRLVFLKLALGANVNELASDYANAFKIRREQAVEILTREAHEQFENQPGQ